MRIFSDRLVDSLRKTGSPCVVGLDPRIDRMPAFMKSGRGGNCIRSVIRDFHELVLDTVAGLVSVVKPQLAFFEQYGSAGIQAFEDTVQLAKQRELIVIADGKRNDVDSTAEAYAAAYLGENAFNVDAMTVTPYLGRDSMLPFVDACREHSKGIFVVLKTSNPGSSDYQDQALQKTGRPLYETVAQTIRDFGSGLTGESGYSSIGAVVGATFPEDAQMFTRPSPERIHFSNRLWRTRRQSGRRRSLLQRGWIRRNRELFPWYHLFLWERRRDQGGFRKIGPRKHTANARRITAALAISS